MDEKTLLRLGNWQAEAEFKKDEACRLTYKELKAFNRISRDFLDEDVWDFTTTVPRNITYRNMGGNLDEGTAEVETFEFSIERQYNNSLGRDIIIMKDLRAGAEGQEPYYFAEYGGYHVIDRFLLGIPRIYSANPIELDWVNGDWFKFREGMFKEVWENKSAPIDSENRFFYNTFMIGMDAKFMQNQARKMFTAWLPTITLVDDSKLKVKNLSNLQQYAKTNETS